MSHVCLAENESGVFVELKPDRCVLDLGAKTFVLHKPKFRHEGVSTADKRTVFWHRAGVELHRSARSGNIKCRFGNAKTQTNF